MQPMPPYADDLDATLAEAFTLLRRGVVDRKSPFRTLNLATVALDGMPSVRTVVLRGFDPAGRIARFHTDRRSAKPAEIEAEPRVSLHGYDKGAQLQLRLSGVATLHDSDAVADAGWARSGPGARACYAIRPAPGTPVAAPVPAPVLDDTARDQFLVVQVLVHRLEWLWLSAGGHRRARFCWDGAGWNASWLVQ